MAHDPSSDARHETRPHGFRPFCGWALETASQLEEQSGIRLVVPLFGASDLRRAAAFLALAAWHSPTSRHEILFSELTAEEFSTWLLREDPIEIAELLDSTWRDPQKLALLGNEPLPAPAGYWTTHDPERD
ncbi:hypothetical protein ACN9JG_21210 (plasmid) [Cereibacter azotoformans]|uniref:hypothetical protein n=1 Tax=Cereibacter TaxID=1653176 RepID=UPI0011A6DDC3|nr:hypothetical protein [Cereibacter sediminicola]